MRCSSRCAMRCPRSTSVACMCSTSHVRVGSAGTHASASGAALLTLPTDTGSVDRDGRCPTRIPLWHSLRRRWTMPRTTISTSIVSETTSDAVSDAADDPRPKTARVRRTDARLLNQRTLLKESALLTHQWSPPAHRLKDHRRQRPKRHLTTERRRLRHDRSRRRTRRALRVRPNTATPTTSRLS